MEKSVAPVIDIVGDSVSVHAQGRVFLFTLQELSGVSAMYLVEKTRGAIDLELGEIVLNLIKV